MKFICVIFSLFACLSSISGAVIKYKAEGLFIVDSEVLKAYMRQIPGKANNSVKKSKAIDEIEKDIRYILGEVNSLFLNFHTDFVIEIIISKIQVLSGNEFSRISFKYKPDKVVTGDILLESFGKWLEKSQMRESHQYDFALLWTGYNIYGENERHTTGFSKVGKICDDDKPTAVVEFDRTYLTALVTAHEIAHLLGTYDRNPSSNYIMTPGELEWAKNRWYFSNCTVTEIHEYLVSLGSGSCLLHTSAKGTKPMPNYNTYKGQMLNADAICQRKTSSSDSYMYRRWSTYKFAPPGGDRLCENVICYVPRDIYIIRATPSEGMVCDVGKRCKRGLCVSDITAPTNINRECLYGDQPFITLSNYNGTCGHYLKKTGPYSCYNSEIREICCASCNALRKEQSGNCSYGNRPSPGIPEKFNGTCEQYFSIYKHTEVCYQGNISVNCCESCKAFYTGIPGCEYGNHISWCDDIPIKKRCKDRAIRQDCCLDCHNVKRSAELINNEQRIN